MSVDHHVQCPGIPLSVLRSNSAFHNRKNDLEFPLSLTFFYKSFWNLTQNLFFYASRIISRSGIFVSIRRIYSHEGVSSKATDKNTLLKRFIFRAAATCASLGENSKKSGYVLAISNRLSSTASVYIISGSFSTRRGIERICWISRFACSRGTCRCLPGCWKSAHHQEASRWHWSDFSVRSWCSSVPFPCPSGCCALSIKCMSHYNSNVRPVTLFFYERMNFVLLHTGSDSDFLCHCVVD